MATLRDVYQILIGQKVLGPDRQWRVYDSNGNELSDPFGVMWRALPGALIMWPRLQITELPAQRPPGGGGPIGSMLQAAPRRKRRPLGSEYSSAEEFDRQVAVLDRIEQEDEIAIALVMAAVPLIGGSKWRH